MRVKIPQLEEAFVGHFDDHHAFLLTAMLARIDTVGADTARLEERIDAEIAPFEQAVARLDEIPGVGRTAACVIIDRGGHEPVLHRSAPVLVGPLRPGV